MDVTKIKQNIKDILKFNKIDKPSSIAYDITHRCQSKCITCNCWQTPNESADKELTTEEWKNFLTEMHNWLGYYTFIISGGEPFIRPDLIEIIDFAAGLGDTVNIVTNGLALNDKIEEIINSKITNISFSLNSIKNPDIHNASRGRKDAFDLTMNALLKLLDAKKNITINSDVESKRVFLATIIMPSNLNEIRDIVEFCKEKDITVCFQLLDNGEAFKTLLDKDISIYNKDLKTRVTEVIDELIDLKKQNFPISNSIQQLKLFKLSINTPKKLQKLKCTIDRTNFSVDPFGNVRICYNQEPVGNIKETKPQDIWYGKNANTARKKIAKCKQSCKLLNCNATNLLE